MAMRGRKYIYELMTDTRHGLLDQIAKGLLWLFSLVYGVVVKITRGLYHLGLLSSYQAPKPVISIGNLTLGGVGKTPLVIWIVKILQQSGINPVVLSRGYGVDKGDNDEIKMFKEIMPQINVMAGKDRKQGIKKALSGGAVDVFVADDAFQHWPLKRDLDIVAIDAVNPFGNGQLVPRGILREKLSALARADIFVLTKIDQALGGVQELYQKLQKINPRALMVESRHQPQIFREIFSGKINSIGALKNQTVFSLCAIGDPDSFQVSLEKLNLKVVKSFVFSDHHCYTEDDLRPIVRLAELGNINILVTTHKDAVKIAAFRNLLKGLSVYCLDIELVITQGQDEFIQRIISLSRR
jgi:tetraacyldisaccharide 4'-kinase